MKRNCVRKLCKDKSSSKLSLRKHSEIIYNPGLKPLRPSGFSKAFFNKSNRNEKSNSKFRNSWIWKSTLLLRLGSKKIRRRVKLLDAASNCSKLRSRRVICRGRRRLVDRMLSGLKLKNNQGLQKQKKLNEWRGLKSSWLKGWNKLSRGREMHIKSLNLSLLNQMMRVNEFIFAL